MPQAHPAVPLMQPVRLPLHHPARHALHRAHSSDSSRSTSSPERNSRPVMVFRQDLLQVMCYTFGCIQSGPTPRQPAEPGQGGFPKGDAATSATKQVARAVSPPRIKPMEGFFMSKEPKPPTQPKGPAPQQPEQSSKTRVFRNLSLAEARERGIPIRNDLVISPVPRDPRKQEDR